MSSLAAARADNFYFPPEWTPQQGSLNKAQGKAPGNLGARAKKMDQGILVIRFEMMFNVWCSGCNHMIAKGVRFNAEKKAIGNYFSTKIWSFTMRAPCCQEEIVIHTDPKSCEYIVVKGATRKVEEFTAEDAETIELRSKDEVAAMRADPFAKLETGMADVQRQRAAAPTIAQLQHMQKERTRDDYELNKQMRREMRAKRKAATALEGEHRALNLPAHIKLLPGSAEDAAAAAAVKFGPQGGRFDENKSLKRQSIMTSPLLGNGGKAAKAVKESSDKRADLLAKRRQLERNGVRFASGAGHAEFKGIFGAGSSGVVIRPSKPRSS